MEQIKVINGFKKKYVIPCFQREYSWGEEEIDELIKNLKNIKENDDYCLGIVTIQDKKDKSLLIDGQQRITTLYLIGIHCGLINKKEDVLLSFEYEELVSNENDLIKLISNKDDIPQNMINGYRMIQKRISEDEKETIINTLKRVYYYEVNIADNIDLNHYFEVMNSRGVQLNRSDIIKSYLINHLKNNLDDSFRLNHLWYKFEKMDGEQFPYESFDQIPTKMKNDYKSINYILKNNDVKSSNVADINSKDENENSILNFDYFLLYVIRLYKCINDDNYEVSGEFNLNDLIKEYEDLFNDKGSEKVIDFLNFMINMKDNYNKHIIKYDNSNESWSLDIKNKDTLLIQSCLRVSFVNRRQMHWLFITLKYFYKNSDVTYYNNIMREYIRDKYIKIFLEDVKDCDYHTGFNTPNIVLNYLDLLIKENYNYVVSNIPIAQGLKTHEFKFKFRNSIEHFKPRHDKDGHPNPDWVEDFGNLALLSYGTNTKMQNAEPDEKAKHFEKELSGYSLKLQIMSKMALKSLWDEPSVIKLRKVMIDLLEKDLELNN